MTDPHGIQTGTHPVDAAHSTHGSAAPFSEVEAEEFHRSDRGAGAVIILLMTGIFLCGVVLYTTVAIATY
jgi:hypothetical protein